jgi:hypothetical protein
MAKQVKENPKPRAVNEYSSATSTWSWIISKIKKSKKISGKSFTSIIDL